MIVEYPLHQPKARKIEKPVEVALVLGGGAFHGMAHVGVIKVLEDAGIPIDLVIGTSAGSMVGALYCDNPHIDSLTPLVSSTKARDIFDFSLFRSDKGFVSGKRLQKYLSKNISVTKIEETQIPFIAIVTNIEEGNFVALKAGPISPSVNASCAIPGIFEPVKMYGTTYVDGGVTNNIAVDVAKTYNPKYIIAVDIMALDTTSQIGNYRKILLRAFHIATYKITEINLKKSDIVITPDLANIPLMGGKDNEKMYNLGMEATEKLLPKIKLDLEERGINLNLKKQVGSDNTTSGLE